MATSLSQKTGRKCADGSIGLVNPVAEDTLRSTVFFDPVCPRPYSARSLAERALGGTESSVIRVAEALGAVVMQHNRSDAEGRYQPPRPSPEVRNLVVLRDARVVAQLGSLFPNARMHLWLHDLHSPGSTRGRWLASAAHALAARQATIICVSDFLRARVDAVLRRARQGSGIGTRRIFNPIDDDLSPRGESFDPSKLVFLSSPNKGLAFTLAAFHRLRQAFPDLQLNVANPGYRATRRIELTNVHWLGALPHARALDETRTALCVFMPNFVIPETFGLVFAEANAVGTPVLTHACGAAEEVLGDSSQLLPVTRGQRGYELLTRALPWRLRAVTACAAARLGIFEAYVARITAWRSGERPVVGPDPRFRLSRIADEWRALLQEEPGQRGAERAPR